MDADAYLDRFHAEKRVDADLPYLAYLQMQHMLHVPFENLDVINQVPITLNREKFFDKIVNHYRGGFCYELNGLFIWLLQQLGYQAHLISGTVHQKNGIWALANSHAAILVELDQSYLVDVGFGDSVRHPLPITGKSINDVSGKYRVIYNEQNELGPYLLQKNREGLWTNLYCFDIEENKLIDFTSMCNYNQTSPDSPFTQNLITTIATENGRITLSDNILTTTKGSFKSRKEANNKEDILEKFFNISLNTDAK
ncbi:arylamine N-acetyltransferase family protein [Virgibacillus ihumii]|uniref:arylamine N-acetyltransferase family protein n=1 Tax=Virgibacillus ihumii TaxID=2686091 RepID=UPI00157DA69A|nr:arylamine N-acetyltransferase [Virgibacillus ihumii]